MTYCCVVASTDKVLCASPLLLFFYLKIVAGKGNAVVTGAAFLPQAPWFESPVVKPRGLKP